MHESNLYLCPRCECHQSLELSNRSLYCKKCHHLFPIQNEITLLVENFMAHEEGLAKARANNPDWYLNQQLPESENPWRHHLKKRRIYITNVLRNELEKRRIKKAARLLDLGCGDGSNLSWLQEFATDIYGSDYNLIRLNRAKTSIPRANFFLADINKYPVRSEFFDVVFFNHVIELIPNDIAALKTAYRILAPGGVLVLGTPNEGAWLWRLAYSLSPNIRKTTDHVHFYTAESISRIVCEAGFQIVEIKHIGWGPPHWRLDAYLRNYKFFDDLFEVFGKIFAPKQASSLYIIAKKDL